MRPKVGVVVVNYNGGDVTLRCLRSLVATAWPAGQLSIVLVDNCSRDGVAAVAACMLPEIQVVVASDNRGFGAGCNLGLAQLEEAEYVALVNPDAFVPPGWLTPLVDALESRPDCGAAVPKLLFDNRYSDLDLSQMATRSKEPLLVERIEADGHEIPLTRVYISRGRRLVPPIRDGSGLRVVPTDRLAIPTPCTGVGQCEIWLQSGAAVAERLRVTVPAGEAYDVINNAGSELYRDGSAGDRGYMHRDAGQFDVAQEVFAWCGACVVLRASYLRTVGAFDETFFLYYEDTDVSWRGRREGWNYLYVPESVVRHLHSATSVEGSALFVSNVQCNRLLLLVRNAPMSLAASAVAMDTVRLMWRVARRATRRPGVAETRPYVLGFARFVSLLLPAAIASRRGLRRRAVVPDATINQWRVRR